MKTVSTENAPVFALSEIRFKDVLNIEELEIDPCQVSAAVGPSGGGKTSLLRILNRMTTPDSGRVLFFGESVENIDPVELRRRCGPVQRPGIPRRSAPAVWDRSDRTGGSAFLSGPTDLSDWDLGGLSPDPAVAGTLGNRHS